MRVSEMQREAHETAKAKGFHDGDRTPAEALALIHSEVTEALDAHAARDAINFAEELADITIRVGDLAGSLDLDIEREVEADEEGAVHIGAIKSCAAPLSFHGSDIPRELCEIHRYTSQALEAYRRYGDMARPLAMILTTTARLAYRLGWSLEPVVFRKMEANKARPRMHGGKRI